MSVGGSRKAAWASCGDGVVSALHAEGCGGVDVTSCFIEAGGGSVIAMLGQPMRPAVVEASTFNGDVLGRCGGC